MNQRPIIYIMLMAIGFSSCSNQRETTRVPEWKIKFGETITLSEYFEEINYVFLENNIQAQFSSADKILYHDSKWFILDKTLNALICYSNEGKFQFKIQNVGKGPGEYTHLEACFIDKVNSEILIHDRIPAKILAFNLDGKFLREEYPVRGGDDLVKLNNGSYLMYNMNSFNKNGLSQPPGLFLLNDLHQHGPVLYTFPNNRMFYRFSISRHFASLDDQVYFICQSDSILTIDQNGRPQVLAILNFGEHQANPEIRQLDENDQVGLSRLAEGSVIWKDRLIPTQKHILFQIGLDNNAWFVIADRNSGEGIASQQFFNDINSLPFAFPSDPKDEDELVGLLSADYIMACKEELPKIPSGQMTKEIYNKWMSFVNQADAGSGYVLVISKLIK